MFGPSIFGRYLQFSLDLSVFDFVAEFEEKRQVKTGKMITPETVFSDFVVVLCVLALLTWFYACSPLLAVLIDEVFKKLRSVMGKR